MNKTTTTLSILGAAGLAALSGYIGYSIGSLDRNPQVVTEIVTRVETIPQVHYPTLTDWDILTLAISKTESDFNFRARGTKGDLGLVQATEIWVRDVNRILGAQVYTHDDALDPRKSLEMFRIIQDHYNPGHDLARAIKLHNPGGDSIGYSGRVWKNVEWVRRYEQVRKILLEQSEISN